jgi:hypothetical protein
MDILEDNDPTGVVDSDSVQLSGVVGLKTGDEMVGLTTSEVIGADSGVVAKPEDEAVDSVQSEVVRLFSEVTSAPAEVDDTGSWMLSEVIETGSGVVTVPATVDVVLVEQSSVREGVTISLRPKSGRSGAQGNPSGDLSINI